MLDQRVVKNASTLTVGRLNELLDELGTLNGLATLQEKKAARTKVFHELITNTTPEEHEWIVRIILKDIKGVGENGTSTRTSPAPPPSPPIGVLSVR